LLDDKSYFFSEINIEGVIAYVVRTNVAVVAGDPVCAQTDINAFIEEFLLFCRIKKMRFCFQSITERTKTILSEMGMNIIKVGEEPIHKLRDFTIQGSKFRSLRKSINQAKRKGLEIEEYFPMVQRNPIWERDMNELSEIWKRSKGSGEYSFLIGKPSLHEPGDRRYFLAICNEHVEAFVVCTPIYSRAGIYFDVMRRREKTISGLPQLLFSECFLKFKEEGLEIATLGTAPLSYEHTVNEDESKIIKAALKLAFNHLGYFHRFKPLYNFKRQFYPSSWEGRYLAYSNLTNLPIILYALLKAYDPTAIKDKLLQQINIAWLKIRKLRENTTGLLRYSANSFTKGLQYTGHKAVIARNRIFRYRNRA
jgi:phosphatidylglycerol lysyltransferase